MPRLDVPSAVVFDLDPGQGRDVVSCGEVALLLRQALDGVGLKAFPKVSGSKGLQLHVPLNTRVTYEETQRFALTTAQALERAEPRLIVTDMSKARRVGKVFIDWSQNSDYKTTVAVYSLRAKREAPFVSMPVRWEELEAAVTNRNADGLYFDPDTALRRLQDVGDLFRPVLRLKQRLPKAVARPASPLRARRMTPKGVAEYSAKPSAGVPRAGRQGGRRRFVVQKPPFRRVSPAAGR